MVLSGRDAVDNWRKTMGPTDPEESKTNELDTCVTPRLKMLRSNPFLNLTFYTPCCYSRLRAKYGTDVKQNALHGASTEADAIELIQNMPDLEIEERPPSISEEDQVPAAGASRTACSCIHTS